MSWNELEKSREDQKSSGQYISLKDGEFVEGVFAGEPKMFYSVFKDPVEYPEWAKGRSFKFKINFIVKDESGKPQARIYKGGADLRDQLLDCIKEYGLDCLYKIKRTGSGKEDTRYSILFKSQLTEAQKEALNKVELIDFSKGPTPKEYDERNPPPPSDSDNPLDMF